MNSPDDDDDTAYITPNIETKLSKEKRQVCRDIVREITRFGVSQRQLLFVIQLLALELENREVMLSLVQAINAGRDKIPAAVLIVPEEG